jgi:hypothetical protein
MVIGDAAAHILLYRSPTEMVLRGAPTARRSHRLVNASDRTAVTNHRLLRRSGCRRDGDACPTWIPAGRGQEPDLDAGARAGFGWRRGGGANEGSWRAPIWKAKPERRKREKRIRRWESVRFFRDPTRSLRRLLLRDKSRALRRPYFRDGRSINLPVRQTNYFISSTLICSSCFVGSAKMFHQKRMKPQDFVVPSLCAMTDIPPLTKGRKN